MNFVTRGVRNAFRNSIRTLSIVLILGLSIGLSLVMFISHQAVQAKIDSVKSSIGNIITVSPAGARGLEGGGEPLTVDQANQIKSITHVTTVTETLQDRLTTTDTNLQSSIAAGSLGRRFNGGGAGTQPTSSRTPQNFTPPIFEVGTNSLNGSILNGGGQISLSSGQNIDTGSDSNQAMLGKDLATKNNLSVGSTFTAYGATLTVAGIFDSGNSFSNNVVVMSLPALQRLSGQTSNLSSIIVQADSITNVQSVVSEIQSKLGASADVTSQQDSSTQALAPLENIKSITMISLIGSIIAGSVIIFLAMLMIVRERRREIGVLKAIGSTSRKIVAQFMVEAVTLTLLASLVGVAIGVLGSAPVTKVLVDNSVANSTQSTNNSPTPGTRPAAGFRGAGQNISRSINNVKVSVGWKVLLYGFVAAIIIAVLGSAIPAWLIAKVRPAEVMRSE
ncbi:MAG: FtsX-like permease family protein [Candidatus Saccharibacteria bacterium]